MSHQPVTWHQIENLVVGRASATTAAFRWFKFDHLPPHLQIVSRPFAVLAVDIVDRLPDDPELTNALNDLRAAKDHAVALAGWVADRGSVYTQ
jgi:hypothetical protein